MVSLLLVSLECNAVLYLLVNCQCSSYIEQTVNHHTQTAGYVIGFIQKQGAVQRWMVNAHQHAEMTKNCLAMAGLDGSDYSVCHKETRPKRIARDEHDVQHFISVVSSWEKQFFCCEDEPLSNISSGQVPSDDVYLDIMPLTPNKITCEPSSTISW